MKDIKINNARPSNYNDIPCYTLRLNSIKNTKVGIAAWHEQSSNLKDRSLREYIDPDCAGASIS